MIKGKKIFITGGAGFIGTNLVERLISENAIIIYDNLHRNSLERYTNYSKHENLTIIKGDILDSEYLNRCIGNPDIVVHLAAIAGVGTVVNYPSTTLKVNMIGAYNILEAIKNKSVERFIDFSTSEVYGPFIFRADENEMTTLGAIGEPRWTYALSKIASEFLTHSYYKEHNIPAVSIRPFNVYGPRQIGEGAIHHFIVNAIKGEELVVHNDGEQIRSWCYIDDFIDGLLLAMEKKEAIGNVFNIGNPKATGTVLDLAEKIIRISRSNSEIVFKNIEYPDVELRVPSIKKAQRLLGYNPLTSYEDGLHKTILWYKDNL